MSAVTTHRPSRIANRLFTALLFFLGGLALTRLLYEALFPRFLWLGRPLPVFLIAGLLAAVAGLAWYGLTKRRGLVTAVYFSPLLLNLLYLFDPTVNLATSRFVFAASLWLTAVFLARQLATPQQWRWLGILFVWLALFPLYMITMPAVAGRADTFEFQVVIPRLGIAHPTGYPLYILLGRLFAALPFVTAAWRINLASAVFAAMAATFLYLAGRRLWKSPLAALLAAVLFGLTPTLWSQAVEAEVYALHALFVASALWLMAIMLDHGAGEAGCTKPVFYWPGAAGWQRAVWLLALVIGFGLTNHLTTIILVPPAVLAVWLAYGRCLRTQGWRDNALLLAKVSLAFFLPLLLYAYLPLRWVALHDEAMGMARFVEWVIGGRFQGALQLSAWLTDLTRYEIVWRLLLAEWGWFNLLLAFAGLASALYRSWRVTLVLLLTLAGYIFYALNYHVPDLAVFLIPAHAVIALFWGAGVAAIVAGLAKLMQNRGRSDWELPISTLLVLLLILPALLRTVEKWPDSTYLDQIALQAWGEGVLSMPLAENSTILADSEKIAPLYYLQQAEGLRPDLEIMVLPDEAAYRAEVDARTAVGEIVYLARFLPGLEGIYHLRSQGPLIEVSNEPQEQLPASATPVGIEIGGQKLLAFAVEEPAPFDGQATAVTLYWQAGQPTASPQFIYVRWSGENGAGPPIRPEGAHPAGNTYPTVAWRPREIVSDFHLLPRPSNGSAQQLDLQVALGLQFASADALAWQTVTTLEVGPATSMAPDHTYRAQNGRILLSQAAFSGETRPGTPLVVLLGGYAPEAGLLDVRLLPVEEEIDLKPPSRTTGAPEPVRDPMLYAAEANSDLPNGRYQLISSDPQSASICGWLAAPASGCVLGEVNISGLPLPPDALNFDDKLALLAINVPEEPLMAGGTLPVQLSWQSMADMDQDYTVFLQVLNEQDQIVGQIDAWPLQGTYPTSQWQPGESVDDLYEIQLDADLAPGNYRLQVGLYLLATLRRLPVLDAQGRPIDDKVAIPGLTIK